MAVGRSRGAQRAAGRNAVSAVPSRGGLFMVAGRLASFRALLSAEAAAARLSSSFASVGNRIEPERCRCHCMAAAVAMSHAGPRLSAYCRGGGAARWATAVGSFACGRERQEEELE